MLIFKEYSTDDDVYFTDENGKTYQSLNDSTHYFGAELEQHVLQDANGNGVTVTETTNGDYYYMDDNGTGYIDNGDGTWTMRMGIVIQNKRRDAAESFFQKGVRLCTILGL